MQCNDNIRDKMGPTPTDAEVSCSLFLYILSTQWGGLRQMVIPLFLICALFSWLEQWLYCLRCYVVCCRSFKHLRGSTLSKATAPFFCIHSSVHFNIWHCSMYSRVSFCHGSFYDDSLLRPLSSRTEHFQLVVHHCRNSSVLSLLSASSSFLMCMCFIFYCSAVLLSLLYFFPSMTSIKKT